MAKMRIADIAQNTMPKKITAKEVERREAKLTAVLDAKNLADLTNRQPEVAKCIQALLEVGYTPPDVGWIIRRDNPQMWVESKFAESVARALINEEG
jgi:hypothetical protein